MGAGGTPSELVEAKGLAQISDSSELDGAVTQAIEDNPDAAEKIREGNLKTIGFLMGQVMKATRGKANPQLVQELIKKQLRRLRNAAVETNQLVRSPCQPATRLTACLAPAQIAHLS